MTGASRRYPLAPIVGVGAVVLTSPTSVVLVRRRHEPLAGRWSLPGGAIEAGETVQAAVVREIREETGLVVEVGPLVDVVEHLEIDRDGRAVYHFVIVDYLCRPVGGDLAPGGDVDGAVAVDVGGLGPYDLTERSRAVIGRALELYTEDGRDS